MKVDVLIAGCGCSGLYLALNLPKDKEILLITKQTILQSVKQVLVLVTDTK